MQRALRSTLRALGLGAAILTAGAAVATAQVASFTYEPATPTIYTPVHFADTSSGSPGTWAWNFGDGATSTDQNPTHQYDTAGTYDVSLQIANNSITHQNVVVTAGGTGSCLDSPSALCLDGGRFQITANWVNAEGQSGTGTGVKLTEDSGYFWFFNSANIEMVVKVLNGCTINNAYWVFAAGLTNVQVDWTVTDTSTGATYVQTSPLGTPFAPVQATQAFPTSCP